MKDHKGPFLKLSLIILFICIISCVDHLYARSAEDDFVEFLKKHEATVKEIQVLYSEFRQTENISSTGIVREKSGHLWASTDGCFRVEYTSPDEILMVYDNKRLLQHYIEDNDIQLTGSDEMDKKTNPFHLWFNMHDVINYYHILECRQQGESIIIRVRDKDRESIISSVTLYIDQNTGLLEKIESTDEGNNSRTTIEFFNYKINEKRSGLFVIPEELINQKTASPSIFYE